MEKTDEKKEALHYSVHEKARVPFSACSHHFYESYKHNYTGAEALYLPARLERYVTQTTVFVRTLKRTYCSSQKAPTIISKYTLYTIVLFQGIHKRIIYFIHLNSVRS